jgi:hypothetical protein
MAVFIVGLPIDRMPDLRIPSAIAIDPAASYSKGYSLPWSPQLAAKRFTPGNVAGW